MSEKCEISHQQVGNKSGKIYRPRHIMQIQIAVLLFIIIYCFDCYEKLHQFQDWADFEMSKTLACSLPALKLICSPRNVHI